MVTTLANFHMCGIILVFRAVLNMLVRNVISREPMFIVYKQFEFQEFVFDSVYVDLQYDDISLIFTGGSVCLYGVYSRVALGLFVRLIPYAVAVTVMRVLLFVFHVCMLRLCEGEKVTAMLVWWMEDMWLW